MYGRLRNVALLIVLAFGFGGDVAQAQSGDSITKQFVGMWRLVSRTQRLADGTTRQHPNSTAYIVYTDTGHMCHLAMNPNRPKWKSATPTPEEALSAITGLGAYCGTVEIHPNEGFLIHHIEIERSPNDVGGIRKRWFTFEGPNRLVLRVDGSEPNSVVDTLVWDRVMK